MLHSLHGKLQKSLRSAHGKSGASKLVRAKLDRPHSLSFFLPCLAARVGSNTNQISLPEMCTSIRVPARASSTKVVDLWFSDLEPFSFHFQPQGQHGDLLMVARTGGRWCCGQAVCVFFPLSQFVGSSARWRAGKLHFHTRAASLLLKMLFTALNICGNPKEHPGESPFRSSCYVTSAAKCHESQSTLKPQRALARATLASQNSGKEDRKEEIWKSDEILCNQVIWGIGWPRRTVLQVYIWGFILHVLERVQCKLTVVFPDNRHCFLHECIICLWLPCKGLLFVHIATDATVHSASLLNWDALPVLCLLSFPLRCWSTDLSTIPAADRHLAPPHHLQLNFIQKYFNSSSLRSWLQTDSTLMYLCYWTGIWD